jgi:tetratricopeptide (TPR) repeat protein
LIGTLSGLGEELHLETSLVDIKTKDVLWKELFRTAHDPKALDDLEDQVTLRVVNVLNANVSPESRSHMMQEVSTNPLAVQLFLAGEREWAERSEASLRNSIRLLSDALTIDTASTIIRGYLALAYSTLVENGYGDSTSWPSAVMHANESLLRNPSNPESLVVLGTYAASIEKDYPKAAVFFDKALTIQPGDAKIHQAIAELHLRTGDIPVGKEHILIARTIEPEHRVVRWIETMYLTASGMLEMAREAADDLMKMYPDYPNIKIFNWQYHLSRKEYQRALNAIPAERSEEAKTYFQSFVFLEQKNYVAFHALYRDRKPYDSLILLEHVQKDEWSQAYALLERLFETDDLHLLAWFQIADFDMFNKMKQDSGIQRIFAYHGIKINVIPNVIEPEI